MGQRGVTEHIIGDAIAEVKQPRGTGAVLIQVARIVSAGTTASRRGRSARDCRAADRRIARDPGVFFFIGATHPGGEVQSLGEVPGALGEQRKTVGLDMAVADAGDISQRARWGAIPDIGLRAVIGEGFIVQIRTEVVGADDVIEELALGRGQAKFLRVLFVFHRHPGVITRWHVETVVVARGEIPEAIGADRGQREVTR
ncbi:hypothetical protein PS681_06122 [Pseudomonas fluorescens]|nr:hypothetical protein PS681_06122 [Pseudomonas fluorescens]